MKSDTEESRNCWFVGAKHPDKGDQTDRFVQQGIWENSCPNDYLDLVRSIRPGDRIAIKSSYKQESNLPFDNQGHQVSVMELRSIGHVQQNFGDGIRLRINWRKIDNPRKWYFYTNSHAVWRLTLGDWKTDALFRFTFEDESQDIRQFRNASLWRDRYGDESESKRRFKWTQFYESIADNLLTYQHKRDQLVEGLHSIASRVTGLSNIVKERASDGSRSPMKDICPFTIMGMFNRKGSDIHRKPIASAIAHFLDVSEPVPDSFDGVPKLESLRQWFFGPIDKRKPSDIDTLWGVFSAAIAFAQNGDESTRSRFISAYDAALRCFAVGSGNLTKGLYWIRPWDFLRLSPRYFRKILSPTIGRPELIPGKRYFGTEYMELLDYFTMLFEAEAFPAHSFPELSRLALIHKDMNPASQETSSDSPRIIEKPPPKPNDNSVPREPYSVESILKDGCFIDPKNINGILECLRTRKNIILQGPPGTGKTWLAKRLAFALIEQRDNRRVQKVQFHPNLSYEDFVRGWRPANDGKLELVDGPFLKMRRAAAEDPEAKYVLVIEEVNRGNPASIFGEMLTLLEADKRNPDEALELAHGRPDGKDDDRYIFIPKNLYVIGTMNIADRSLALVDLALRRRFAFIRLEPRIGKSWIKWVQSRNKIDSELLLEIKDRINDLNKQITDDTSLGSQYQVGHSYVTPSHDRGIDDGRQWFRRVVETEIGPLLDEYWYDAPDKAEKAKRLLLKGF